jgi:4-diphosphocytidyl-2-C-methyl-D-erythritol kinase
VSILQGFAPAKLNLFLHITARRNDGYHCLQTIFQFLDFCDQVSCELREDGEIHCHSNASDLPMQQDLVYRAAQLLKNHSGTTWGATLQVAKKIYMGGGLGGGSSDAATTLLLLNQLWQLNLPKVTLATLGLQLGADVPIFIHGHAAWAEGVGDLITPINLPEPWYVVIHPNCHVATKDVFAAPELQRNCSPISLQDYHAGRANNVCEPVVRQRYPAVNAALNWLARYGEAKMTGTGASVFAAFTQQAAAELVLAELPKMWQGFVAQGKNFSPMFTAAESG